MDQYRKLILDSHDLMIYAKESYIHLGFEICLLDELKELDGYMDGETFQMDILGTMEDKAVLRIHQFATESDVLIKKLYEDNNLLTEEIMEYEEFGGPQYESAVKIDRLHLLALLCLYTQREVSEITKFVDEMCYINNDPPLKDYTDTSLYDDENVKIIAAFYAMVKKLNDDIIETEIKGWDNASSA
ncbi:MAG: hypothetical protein M3139_14930 [Bacteroidota bacterium]|nr:hypothetical protein [Bacteroidota bacterium]